MPAMIDLAPKSTVARWATLRLVGVTVVIFTAFVTAFGWHRVISPAPDVKEWLDIGGESNLPTWWNATLLVLVALAALVAACFADRSSERRAWWIVGLAAAYLSVDEATQLHERLAALGERSGLDLPTYAWLVPGVIVAAIGATVLVVAGRALPPTTGARLGLALALFAFASLGLEALGGWLRDRTDDSPWFTLAIIVEEGVEMLACILAVGAIIDAHRIERDGGRIVVTRRARLSP
jgi:MFS family permease